MAGVQLVGREPEREAIERWLDGERPGLLIIDGEAGIGKSTLWSHAVDRATEQGDRVLAWRVSVAERDLAFSALNGLFDAPVVAVAVERLADPRRRALEIALGRLDPDARRPEPSLVGLAVADALRALAADRALVVAIDDIQWLDQPSEAALAFAARRLRSEPVGFVLARRTDGPPGRLSETRAPPGSGTAIVGAVDRRRHIEVGPMSVGAVGRLLRERLGVAYARPLLVRLHHACGGNPFLGLEMGRSLIARGAEPGPGEPFPVPAETGPLVRDHLAALSRDARRSLVIVAMAAEPKLDLVRRVLGRAGDRAVDEAFEKGVLVADGQRVRPAHPLYASTAYADCPPGERQALRQALAEIADDPVERAIHLAGTVERPDPEVAEALASAAHVASGRGAPGVAATLLELAAHAEPAESTRAERLIEAAEAALAAGDADRAAAALRTVLAEVPEGRRRAEALTALGDIVYVEAPEQGLGLLRAALEHVGGDPLLEATIHSHIVGASDPDIAVGLRSAEREAEILLRPDVRAEPNQLACALLDRAALWLFCGIRVAREDIDRALALLDRSDDSFLRRRSEEAAQRCLWMTGRYSEAMELDEGEYRRLADRGQVGLLPPLLQAMATTRLFTGRPDLAGRYTDEIDELVEQGEELWRERARMPRAWILAYAGELDAARRLARAALSRQEAEGDLWEATIWTTILGFVEISVPDPTAALEVLGRALEQADAMEIRLPSAFAFLGDYVEAAVLAGRIDLAEAVVSDRLEDAARRLGLPWDEAMAARGRGLIEAAAGRNDSAVEHYGRALEVLETRSGLPLDRGRLLLLRGDARRRLGQRRAARGDLEAAIEVFDGLGAAVWAGRAREELGRLGGRAPARQALTVAERTVAELAATGLTNREIAARLVVSVRTVESQLSAAYRKLDIRSRAALRDALGASTEMGAG